MTEVWTVFSQSHQAVLAVFSDKGKADDFAGTVAGNPYIDGPFEVDKETRS